MNRVGEKRGAATHHKQGRGEVNRGMFPGVDNHRKDLTKGTTARGHRFQNRNGKKIRATPRDRRIQSEEIW